MEYSGQHPCPSAELSLEHNVLGAIYIVRITSSKEKTMKGHCSGACQEHWINYELKSYFAK